MSNEWDQFFTPPDVAKRCYKFLQEKVDLPSEAHFVEPSFGAGAFYDLLPSERRGGFEIDPELAAKRGGDPCDFLELSPLENPLPANKPLVFVGNPAFGYRGKTAVAFLNKAFDLGAQYVAFILPPAFKPYDDGEPPIIEKRVKGGHSVAHMDVPPVFILRNGKEKKIAGCVFVIYKKGDRDAKETPVSLTCDSYIECHTINQANWRVREGKTYGGEWIGKCDLYFPGSGYEGRGMFVTAYDDCCKKEMVGVIIKREKEKLMAYLRGLDWEKTAVKRLGDRLSITPAVIKRAVIAGGFVDNADGRQIVSVHTIRTYRSPSGKCGPTGQHHIESCDVFLPNSLHEGQKHKMKAYDSFCLSAMFGVKIHRDKERLLGLIKGFDWLSVARESSNKNVSLGTQIISRTIEGLAKQPADCASYATLYSIGAANKKAGRTEWGQDKIVLCDFFLPNSRRHGQAVEVSETKDFDIVIGIQIHKDRDRLTEFLRTHDWTAAANKSSNRNVCLNLEIVRREIIAAGFVDGTEPPQPAADSFVKVHYIVLKGKYQQNEDRIDDCQLFLPACAYGDAAIAASDRMKDTRAIGFEIADHPQADQLRDWILSFDWEEVCRPAPTTHRHIGKRLVERELAKAGFAPS